MAIGDAVAVYLGTGTVNRQPAAGVEEQITAIIKNGLTDAISLYNGTLVQAILVGTVTTRDDPANTSQRGFSDYNTALMITNSLYLRKEGTTDTIAVLGVQTNV